MGAQLVSNRVVIPIMRLLILTYHPPPTLPPPQPPSFPTFHPSTQTHCHARTDTRAHRRHADTP
jgi:hypothetical protein